jgi:hypothetical protein
MMRTWRWGAAATALLAAAPLPAQSWRTLTAKRQLQSVDTLHVHVQYGAGKLVLGAAPAALLYDLRLRYDADQFRPARAYDTATHTLTVGADSATVQRVAISPRGVHFGRGPEDAGDLALGIARTVPVALMLELGATDAQIDLSDLRVSRLRMDVAATDTRLTFGTPNPVPLSELDIATAATDLTVRGLGNAHAERVRVTTRLGDTNLDLSGEWSGDLTLSLHTLLGGTTLHVPRDVGVQARVSKLLGDFTAPGMTERDGTFYSANWAQAKRRLVIEGDATLAGITVVWVE